jgi:hypothetical protein
MILIVALSFFFLMLIIPTTYQVERGVFLVLLCLAAFQRVFADRCIVHRSVLLVFLVCIVSSLVFITLGVVNGAAGALKVSTVFVVWPLIYILFIGSFRNLEVHIFLLKTLIFGIFVSCIIGFFLVADGFGLFSNSISSFLESQGGMVGIYDGKFEYSIPNIATIIYGFPFLFALLALPKSVSFVTPVIRRLSFFAFILCSISLFLAGRRASILTALLTPFVTLILFRLSGLRSPYDSILLFKSFLFILLISIFLVIFFDINFSIIFDDFLSAFDFSNSSDRRSSSLRGEQFFALMNGWIERPFFGYGLGSGVASVIRDVDSPWAYELSYVALLYQVGFIGFSVYASSVIWLYVRSIQLIRKNHENASLLLPLLIALSGFLIANATNPYLAKFDYLWTIFLPVSILNALLLNSRSGSKSSNVNR